jgi:hypothetical protein
MKPSWAERTEAPFLENAAVFERQRLGVQEMIWSQTRGQGLSCLLSLAESH